MEREIRQIVFKSKEKKKLRTAAYNTLFADKEKVIENAKKQEQTFLIQQFIHTLTKYDHPLTEWDESM